MENLEQFVYSINRDSKLLENALEESSYDKMVFSYSEDLKYEITCAIKNTLKYWRKRKSTNPVAKSLQKAGFRNRRIPSKKIYSRKKKDLRKGQDEWQ